MGKRILALLLSSAAAVCGLTGCGHKTEITGQPADTAINIGQTEAEERVSGRRPASHKKKSAPRDSSVLRSVLCLICTKTLESCTGFFTQT